MADRTDRKFHSPGEYRLMPQSRKPYCAHCKEGITPDKRLYSCAECHRHYHPACYGRTLPGQPIDSPDWTCRRCLEKKSRRGSASRMAQRSCDHDSKSTSSYGHTAKSMTSAGSQRKPITDMSSFTSFTKDGLSPTAKCTYPRCSSRPVVNTDMCSLHSGAKQNEQDQSLRPSQNQGLGHLTTTARLLPDHGLGSVLPVIRRKTGSNQPFGQAPLGPGAAATKAKTNASAASLSREAHSPPENGPARKKQRVDNNTLADSATKADVVFKKPWDTGFNPRQATKPRGYTYPRAENYLDPAVRNGTARLSAVKTQRKFAPRIELAFKPPSEAEKESVEGSDSDSPAPNGSLARGSSLSTSSPQSSGKETGNESLRRFFERRASVRPERAQDVITLSDTSSSVPPASNGGRTAEADNWVFPDIRIVAVDNPHLYPQPGQQHNKQPTPAAPAPISQQYHEGWHLPSRPENAVLDMDFDSLIYNQEGAAPPPRGVHISHKASKPQPPPKPEPPDEPYYAHIDPRVHWPQEHSEEWYETKMREIDARGGRKANFGKAAQRLKEQREQEEPVSWEDSLPERVRENPAWVRALRELKEEQPREAGVKKRGKPGPKPRQGVKRETSSVGPKTPRKSTGSFRAF